MAEIIQSTVLERFKICDEDIREFAKHEDDVDVIREMARTAVASIVPELNDWREQALDLATETVFYAATENNGHDRRIDDEIFMLQGILGGGAVCETFKKSGGSEIIDPKFGLYLRLKPQLKSEKLDLILAESALVPVSSVGMIDKVCV